MTPTFILNFPGRGVIERLLLLPLRVPMPVVYNIYYM